MNAPRDIVILKPSSLGDIVHTLPAVALVKRQWPASRIRWVVNSEWMPLLEGNPHIDEAIEFPRRKFRGVRGALKIAPWATALRERVKADLVLDFQGLLRSALIAKLCCAAGGRIVGLSDAREGARLLYHQVVKVSPEMHAADRYLALVADLGIPTSAPLEWPLPEGQPPAGFSETEPFLLLHPFSRGKNKSLNEEQAAALCRAVAPLRVVIAGRSESAIEPIPNALDLLNRTTIQELVWLIRRAAFVVSVDSGPMHIASALTGNLLGIHTWSDPRMVGPYNPEAWVWKNGGIMQVKSMDAARLQGATNFEIDHVAGVVEFLKTRSCLRANFA